MKPDQSPGQLKKLLALEDKGKSEQLSRVDRQVYLLGPLTQDAQVRGSRETHKGRWRLHLRWGLAFLSVRDAGGLYSLLKSLPHYLT